jgi:hypothetical protein
MTKRKVVQKKKPKPLKEVRPPLPKPKTDDPAKDKSTMKDGVLQPLPAAD